jgi:hypothetical protein
MPELNRYAQIIQEIFSRRYEEGTTEISFERSDIVRAAQKMRIKLPKNLGDVLYSFRYRTSLPNSITGKAPAGYEWIIRPAGRARYRLVLAVKMSIVPSRMLAETKIPDATPGVINKYSLSDEQALLAKVRYNRLIDIFTGLTCYSLQNHLRTTVPHIGQVETDEIYVGIDKRGVHFVLPVQAKAASERLGIVQIEQDFAVGATKFPNLICRPVAAQFMAEDLIALFEFEQTENGVRISAEKHYKLVRPEELTPEELETYKTRSDA